MKVNLQMIYDRLSDKKAFYSQKESDGRLGWYQAGELTPEFDFTQPVLAAGYASDFPDTIRDAGFICIGTPSEELLKNNDVICLPEQTDLQEALLEVRNIFVFFQQWADDLSRALEKDNSLSLVFQIAGKVFDNPMFMHDRNFYRLADANEPPNEGIWEKVKNRGYYVISMEVMNAFKVEPAYLATMSTKGASLYPADSFGYRILYYNLWRDSSYQGRICINEMNRPFLPSDYHLLNYFAHIVTESFKAAPPREDGQMRALSHFLTGLIEEQVYEKADVDSLLIHYNWAPFDRYYVACFMMSERDSRTNSLQYQRNRLQQLIPSSCVFVYEEEILMLVNTTLNEMTLQEFRQKLALPVREGLMKVGISEEMSDISLFRYYYLQAKAAFQIGNRKHEIFWIYSFDEYKNTFLMENARGGIPAGLLIHEGIRLLRAYDQTGTAELTKTLRVYLENERSIQLTSAELGIHRTTLFYRLKRIRELTGLDLDNKNVRFSLLFSFRLAES